MYYNILKSFKMWNNTRLLTSRTAYLKPCAVLNHNAKRFAYYRTCRDTTATYHHTNGDRVHLKCPSLSSFSLKYINTAIRRNSSYSERKSQKFILNNRLSNTIDDGAVKNNNKANDDCSEPANESRGGFVFDNLKKEGVRSVIDDRGIPDNVAAGKIQNIQNAIIPYFKLIRIDKPIGSWLLFWPCGWSILLASDPSIMSAGGVAQTMGLFLAGAVVMRGAGCTINDMWDKDIDAKVERTRSRPLVSGAITRKKALVFLAAQLSLGLTILLQLNWYSVALGASSMILVVLYPLAKRVTDYPQFVLGLAFNWGALLGFSAVTGQVDPAVCLPLYAAGVCWTLLYDTIYAHQDKRDDAIIGVRSTALKFGSYTKPCLAVFSGGMVSCLTAVGVAADLGLPYFMTLGLVGAHTAKQIITLDTENPRDCAEKFVSNSTLGMLIFFGILAGKWKTIKEYINDMQTNNGKQPTLLELVQ